MGVLAGGCWLGVLPYNSLSGKTHLINYLSTSGNPFGVCDAAPILSSHLHPGIGSRIVAFASRKSAKKSKRNQEREQENEVTSQTSNSFMDDFGAKNENSISGDGMSGGDFPSVSDNSDGDGDSIVTPSRNNVLQACSLTCSLIAALGLAIRQVSQVASSGGLHVYDCSEVSFGFEMWHLELIMGLVVLISLSRYTLLKVWPDFAKSSEASNAQVLTSLQTLDYLIVAFLPGISEELLFRGGLLPLLGLNWKSVFAVAALFGVLHLGGGRKFPFAVWATFVGLAYGYATIVSSSLVVPMASHSLNNLVGALIWRFTSVQSNQRSS